jgi:hypothetical protein
MGISRSTHIIFFKPPSILLRMAKDSDKRVKKIKHFSCWIIFFLKLCRFIDNVEKSDRAEQTTDDNMVHAHFTLGTCGYRHTISEHTILITFLRRGVCTNALHCYTIHTYIHTLPPFFYYKFLRNYPVIIILCLNVRTKKLSNFN